KIPLKLPVVRFVGCLRGDDGPGSFPDLFLPNANAGLKLKSGLRMGGISFEANYGSSYGHLVLGILGNGELHFAADAREPARQVNERAFKPDILGQAVLDDFLSAVITPFYADREGDDVSGTATFFLHNVMANRRRCRL